MLSSGGKPLKTAEGLKSSPGDHPGANRYHLLSFLDSQRRSKNIFIWGKKRNISILNLEGLKIWDVRTVCILESCARLALEKSLLALAMKDVKLVFGCLSYLHHYCSRILSLVMAIPKSTWRRWLFGAPASMWIKQLPWLGSVTPEQMARDGGSLKFISQST